jgi:putative CocE/NonD family hydrolase
MPAITTRELPIGGLLDLTIETDVPCRVQDGTTLRADVYRPRGEGPFPVILMRTPYSKTHAQANSGPAHPAWFARHGYMVVVQDCRGRWASEGDYYPFRDEAADGYDTVEWAASLDGSNGKVGMYGFSYPGATQLLAATKRPPHLATICPGFTTSQYYEEWTYNQGAFCVAFMTFWANFLALDTLRRDGRNEAFDRLRRQILVSEPWNWQVPLMDYEPLREAGAADYFFDWLEHSSYDDYWRQWSIDEDYSRIEVPALHFGGWYDLFVNGTVRNFTGLRREAASETARAGQKLLIGPWTHSPWYPLPGAGSVGATQIDDWLLRWFDQFLKDRDTGVLDAAATVFVLGRGWQDFDAWPPSSVEHVDWFLHSDGRANSAFGDGRLSSEAPTEEPPDVYTYDPDLPNVSVGGHSCCPESNSPIGPKCQAETESAATVLVYTSEPLEDDLDLVGDVSMTLYAATTAVDTDFTARLCIVDEGGCSKNLQEGIVRARFRESLHEPSLVTPGEVYEYRIHLGPVGVRIARGQRLRVHVSSSDFPLWDRNFNTGESPAKVRPVDAVVATQVVLHNRSYPSRITLPVLPH